MPGVLPQGSFLRGNAPVKEKLFLVSLGQNKDFFDKEQLIQVYGINYQDGIDFCELLVKHGQL